MQRAQALAVLDADIGEEDFVEAARTAHLVDGLALDSGRLHVDPEHGEALMLHRIGIGPDQHDAILRHNVRPTSRFSGR
jgi:hypothetical protein